MLSLIEEFHEKTFVQNDGICIGAVIVPILSDLFLAKCDKDMQVKMPDSDVIRVLRYVNDYVVLFCKMDDMELTTLTKQFLDLLEKNANGLSFSVEMPEKNRIRCLDLTLSLNGESICWCFEPRAGKTVLLFNTAHTKLVKRGIVTSCLGTALQNSCTHNMETILVCRWPG